MQNCFSHDHSYAHTGGGRSGDWICGCGNNNFAFRMSCNKCGGPKTEGGYFFLGRVLMLSIADALLEGFICQIKPYTKHVV